MILMRILPGVLKELLKHVPTVMFEAVDWSVLAHELPKLSRRIIKKEGYSELLVLQNSYLRPFSIQLVEDALKSVNLKHNAQAAEKILALYFAQLFSPHGLFLDLRSEGYQIDGEILKWHPSGIWTQFKPEFSLGLSEIYDGFYLEDQRLFEAGLMKIGLTSPHWPESDRKKLSELFKAHFGSSLGSMVFDLETFKKSLLRVADFMLEKKVKISTDFLYLGIALVTLYSSLEISEEPLNVKGIYLSVRTKLQTK